MASLGLLLIRAVTGFFLMGHGAQKLFGAFGGREVLGGFAQGGRDQVGRFL